MTAATPSTVAATRFEADLVRGAARQLGGVLEHDQPVGGVGEVDHRREQGGLARRRRATDDDVAPRRHDLGDRPLTRRVGEVGEGPHLGREATDRQGGTADGDRGHHGAHPRPVGEASIHDRARAVDPPADRREDSFDHLLDAGAGEMPRPFDVAVAVDPHVVAVDEHFVDARIRHEDVEFAETHHACHRVTTQRRALGRGGQRSEPPHRAVDQVAEIAVDVAHRITHLVEETRRRLSIDGGRLHRFRHAATRRKLRWIARGSRRAPSSPVSTQRATRMSHGIVATIGARTEVSMSR